METTTNKLGKPHLNAKELRYYSEIVDGIIQQVGTQGLDEAIEHLGCKSPRQLAEENKVLLGALKSVNQSFNSAWDKEPELLKIIGIDDSLLDTIEQAIAKAEGRGE